MTAIDESIWPAASNKLVWAPSTSWRGLRLHKPGAIHSHIYFCLPTDSRAEVATLIPAWSITSLRMESVVEGVKLPCGILLGTAVEHALEGLKTTDAFVSDYFADP